MKLNAPILALVASLLWPAAAVAQQTGEGQENPTAPFTCIPIETGQVGFGQIEGSWWIGAGEHALLNLGGNREDAEMAARRVNDLGIDNYCFIETASGGRRLQIWLSGGLIPDVVARADTCTEIDWNTIAVEERDGGYAINNLPRPAGHFDSAVKAEAIIGALRRNGARVQCVTREGSAFHYFVR